MLASSDVFKFTLDEERYLCKNNTDCMKQIGAMEL